MSQSAVYQNIIKNVSQVVENNQQIRNAKGLDFNIFTLLDKERNELEIHENMLFAILNFNRNEKIRRLFVQKFLEVLALPKIFTNEIWEIEQEYYISIGRIDLFFKSKGKKKKCIAVEIKIDADDQERQLERYEEYILKSKYEKYRIVYLTLNGKEPSEQSRGSIKWRKLLCVSFKEHISKWLEECIAICRNENIEFSFLQQYKILIEKIVGEDDMQEEITNLIKTSEELKASIAIANTLPLIKGDILFKFLESIKEEFKNKNCDLLCSVTECGKEYYGRNAQVPYIAYRICDFKIGTNKTVVFGIGIEIDYHLGYYFGFYKDNGENYELENINHFKGQHKRICRNVENAIIDILNVEIRENSYKSIWYEDIKDKNNHKYDFKHFTNNCADLMDNRLLKSEAKRISRELLGYMNQIKEYLERQ